MAESPHFAWPQETRETVHLGKTLIADDFSIAAPTGANAVRANVIKALTSNCRSKVIWNQAFKTLQHRLCLCSYSGV